MGKSKVAFFFLFFFAFAGSLHSRTPKTTSSKTDSVVQLLQEAGSLILAHPQFAKRDSANTVFTEVLKAFLGSKAGFVHPLDTVKNAIRLSDTKQKVVIVTWQMPNQQFEYKRFGMVAAKSRKGEIEVTLLQDAQKDLGEAATFKMLRADKWFGALYYKLLPIEKDDETMYTLLGYIPGKEINQKVVEILSIDFRGRPRFGNQVFLIEKFEDAVYKKPPMRLILKYTPNHSASLRWLEKEQMIVMDHLSPPDAAQIGQYQYYGPDFSYDALVWKNNWWELKEQVTFNSGQNIQIRPPAPRDTGSVNN